MFLMQLDSARKDGTQDKFTGEAKVVNENVEAVSLSGDKSMGWEKIYGVDGAFSRCNSIRQMTNYFMIAL